MSNRKGVVPEITRTVGGTCMCLHLQRAARAVARRFDDAFRPLGLTSGQFSLMMSLYRVEARSIGNAASILAMDRTTLTANLKPLVRRRLLKVGVDPDDKRSRRLSLTTAGRALLESALPVWRRTHAEVDLLLGQSSPDRLREDLRALS